MGASGPRSPAAAGAGGGPRSSEGGGEERSGRHTLDRSRLRGAGTAEVESRGGWGGSVGAAQDHSGGGGADGMQARRTEGRSKEAAAYGWGRVGDLAREGGRPQCKGNKYVDSNGAPPPGAP